MCGIFGIITPKPRKLDLRAFCVLGVNNDSRGGDSCGIFIDKRYEYGVNENKLFYNFFPRSKVLNSVNTCQIALGHCRKASVGAINAANAQPVVIKDEYGNVMFVLIHNGTIINYQELAKKYLPGIDIKDMTDSQVMARIFYHRGYGVLEEYLGAGAFVMVDYRNGEPEVFLFKGESKLSEYSVSTQIERPLFCTYSSNEFIFSSIMDYLKALRPSRDVMTVTPNKLLQLKDGKLLVIGTYDRKKKWQTRSSSTVNSYVGSSVSRVCNLAKYSNDNYYNNGFGNGYWDDVVEMDPDGTYSINNVKAHGIYWVDALGNIEPKKMRGTIQAAFWKGVLLKNVSCFSYLSKLSMDLKLSAEGLLTLWPDLVHYLSPCACWQTHDETWVKSETYKSREPYTGTAVFPFTTEEFYFDEGTLEWYTDGVPYKETIVDLQNSQDFKIDKDALPFE